MDYISILLALSYFLSLFVVYLMERRIFKGDVFSPGRIHVYFSGLAGLPLLWFSLGEGTIEDLIFSQVSSEYHSYNLIHSAYFYTLINFMVSYAGIVFGSLVSHKYSMFFLNVLIGGGIFDRAGKNPFSKVAVYCGLIIFIIGLFIYFYFLSKMGGLSDLWTNLDERVQRSAGLGYFQIFYSFSIYFGSLLIAYYYLLRKKYLQAFLIIVPTILIMASLGQRGPVAAYIFALIVVHHYKVRKIKNLFNPKIVALCFLMLVFMLAAVQFRSPGAVEKYSENPVEILNDAALTLEQHVIARFGRLERDIVILGYFEKHNYWYGASYTSLVTAPLPSTIYTEKPPIDTGRYLLAMAQGEIIDPPVPISKLPPSSLPEANWAGYMNFGIPGLFCAFFLAGVVLGIAYQYMRIKSHSISTVIFYCIFAWMGIPALSPMGIFNIIVDVALFSFWCLLPKLLFLILPKKE